MIGQKNNIKVTPLSIEEVKKKIYDDDVENVYVLVSDGGCFMLYKIRYSRLKSIIEHMSDGSAFLKIEVVKNDDRTEE